MRQAPNSMMMSRKETAPLVVPRTMRRHAARGITSLPAGKMVPIAAFPLLREDAVRSGRLRFSFESMETAEILMNAINVRVRAYLIPWLAFARFNGSMDQLNLSYQGQPPLEGEDVVPFIETHEFGVHRANKVYEYLGLHGREEQLVNTGYLEAYNILWNFLAENRSPDLALRTRLQTDLAPAFWAHEQFRHIVPDVDLAKIDGEVPLNVVLDNVKAYVHTDNSTGVDIGISNKDVGFRKLSASGSFVAATATASTAGNSMYADLSEVFGEMQSNGLSISLSNIELARKSEAFATLRQKYQAHDEWVINLLMDGISIPEQALKQPMLIADRRTVFGMAKRYATDSGNLTESVVNGATYLDMSIQTPRIGTGGIIMVVAEITPDQLFERQEDPFLHTVDHETLPQYLRDTLDPEKIDIVHNGRIDVDHTTPNARFGYEPTNARWNIDAPRVGGRFYRPAVDGDFDEDRQRIWSVETANPTLSTDFYLCTSMNTKPFVVSNQDPFEALTQGDLYIEGNTQFGPHLVEGSDDYAKVLEKAPQERIEPEA